MYRVRIKGPTGCAGQKRTVVFRVRAITSAGVIISGSDTYDEFGENEEDIVHKPSPASNASISASAGVGNASSSSSATYNFPSAGSDMKGLKTVTGLISREVTFDSNERAEVEIPFSLHIQGDYSTPSTNSEGGVINTSTSTSNADAAVSLFQDSRAVTLTRSGAINERVVGDTTYGDTTYSYWDKVHPFQPGSWRDNWQTMQAGFGGAWSERYTAQGNVVKNVDFSWSPPGPSSWPDTITNSYQMADRGQLAFMYDEFDLDTQRWQGTPDAPSTRTILYTATDRSDGATAVAKYNLTFHNEVEKDSETTTVVTSSGPLWPSVGKQPHDE